MPKVVEVPGIGNVEFPDSMNDDAIAEQIKKSIPTEKPEATISAAPEPEGIGGHIARWTDNVAHDLKYGTDLTGVGSVLKSMGAHGLNVGNSEKIGEFMGSMPLGLLRYIKGQAEAPSHPVQGAKDIIAGGMQAAQIPSLLAPEVEAAPLAARAVESGGKALVKAGSKALEMIPSAERASARFSGVMAAAHDLPINITTPGDIALRTQQLAESGGSMPKIMRDFIKRATDPNKGALTYKEARDFYSNATRLSADESMRLTPIMKRQVGMFTDALNTSLEQAAEHVGKLSDYQKAMSEYHNAMRLRAVKEGAIDLAKKHAAQAAVAAGAGVAGGYAVKELLK